MEAPLTELSPVISDLVGVMIALENTFEAGDGSDDWRSSEVLLPKG
jgi:hypothetical protein